MFSTTVDIWNVGNHSNKLRVFDSLNHRCPWINCLHLLCSIFSASSLHFLCGKIDGMPATFSTNHKCKIVLVVWPFVGRSRCKQCQLIYRAIYKEISPFLRCVRVWLCHLWLIDFYWRDNRVELIGLVFSIFRS